MKLLKIIAALCLLCVSPAAASDVSVTATSVVKGSNPGLMTAAAASTVTAGQPLYVTSTGAVAPAKGDTAAHAVCVGIALNGGAAGQPIQYQTSGTITFNAGFTVGIIYCVSAANAGAIAPASDLTTGNYITVLGIATSTSTLQLGINVSGVTQ